MAKSFIIPKGSRVLSFKIRRIPCVLAAIIVTRSGGKRLKCLYLNQICFMCTRFGENSGTVTSNNANEFSCRKMRSNQMWIGIWERCPKLLARICLHMTRSETFRGVWGGCELTTRNFEIVWVHANVFSKVAGELFLTLFLFSQF